MWAATVDGRRLHFHLAGINNQNFLMQDEETGSWWQQATGDAILGPLAGRHLEPIEYEELTFAMWKRESPGGRVLRPAADGAWDRFSARWEEDTAKMPVVTPGFGGDDPLPARAVVLGVERAGAAKAYPLDRLEAHGAITDAVGGVPILLVLGEDRKTVRAFEAVVDGREVSLFVKVQRSDSAGAAPPLPAPIRILDQTGRAWDFAGVTAEGPPGSPSLRRIPVLRDYWFDWKTYHPATDVFGARGATLR